MSMSQDKLLATLSLSLQGLAQRGTLRNFSKNAIIVSEGDAGDTLFVLIKGQVRVFSADMEGREITYGLVQQDDFFGEMALDGGHRSASVMALEPCMVSVVKRAAVREHLEVEPGFAMELVARVIDRARKATEAARGMALLGVYGRVAALLDSYGGSGSEQMPFAIYPITHLDIAKRVGASREMVSRLLKDLEKGQYIKLGIKQLTLLKKLPTRW